MQVHEILPIVSGRGTHCTIVTIAAAAMLCKVMACASQIAEDGRKAGVVLEVLPLTTIEAFLPMLDVVWGSG